MNVDVILIVMQEALDAVVDLKKRSAELVSFLTGQNRLLHVVNKGELNITPITLDPFASVDGMFSYDVSWMLICSRGRAAVGGVRAGDGNNCVGGARISKGMDAAQTDVICGVKLCFVCDRRDVGMSTPHDM